MEEGHAIANYCFGNDSHHRRFCIGAFAQSPASYPALPEGHYRQVYPAAPGWRSQVSTTMVPHCNFGKMRSSARLLAVKVPY
jgi:hypothetical protein